MFRFITRRNKIFTISDNGTTLDLSYITKRIIAMCFPASSMIEKTYRNNINEVANFLNSHHKDRYLVFNISDRKVEEKYFRENSYFSYSWKDHYSPSLEVLFDICLKA